MDCEIDLVPDNGDECCCPCFGYSDARPCSLDRDKSAELVSEFWDIEGTSCYYGIHGLLEVSGGRRAKGVM